LDKEQLIKGFNQNLNAQPTDDCLPEIKKLFGPTYQDFNKKYVKSGSLCMGKMTGHAFYSDIKKLGGLNLVNLEMVKKGYADGLYLRDTVMKEAQMRQIMQEFMVSLNEKAGIKMLEKAKKHPKRILVIFILMINKIGLINRCEYFRSFCLPTSVHTGRIER
jgi:hypothetical protein